MRKTGFGPNLSNAMPNTLSERSRTSFLASRMIDNCNGRRPLFVKNGIKTVQKSAECSAPNEIVSVRNRGKLNGFFTSLLDIKCGH